MCEFVPQKVCQPNVGAERGGRGWIETARTYGGGASGGPALPTAPAGVGSARVVAWPRRRSTSGVINCGIAPWTGEYRCKEEVG